MRFRLYAAAVSLFAAGLAPCSMAQVGDNDCLIEVGDFRTQTQGGWGIDDCSGDNPACYRNAHFMDAFPDGVTPRWRLSDWPNTHLHVFRIGRGVSSTRLHGVGAQ